MECVVVGYIIEVDLNFGVIISDEENTAERTIDTSVNNTRGFLHLYKSTIRFPEFDKDGLLMVRFY
jgi:hypothetical protein